CIPVPVETNEIHQLKKEIEELLKLRPNIIEFRLDYIKDIESLTTHFLKELLTFIGVEIPVIFTFRKFSEGGKLDIENKKRYDIINQVINLSPTYVDIEMDNDDEFLQNAIKKASNKNVKIIFSYHNFNKTPDYETVIELLSKFKAKFDKLTVNLEKSPSNYLIKLIFYAQNFEDNIIPLRICKELGTENQKIISFCMGELGILSRIFCLKAGSYLTYGSYKEQTAPGQISITTIREILKYFS
ncbi:MAG: type I 3-dehydroquinate dehydratase, partial [Candidatus Lokiarchaeota archaeon]|nr:type I 3-dehydroquinate dehydratase [Candidatus Lokiarchaeota archaeon]